MINFWTNSTKIKNDIYIPKYYDPEIEDALESIASTHICMTIDELKNEGIISYATGHEIGKNAYGTGNIPFVRTSDIANWEIKTIPKQGVSAEIYNQYAAKQDVKEGDILFVRDGTYLIGVNCFITSVDKELLYQSHILKIRVEKTEKLEPEILFLLLNSNIVQKQIRSFQFTSDIIDTIGQRFGEIVLPIPKSKSIRDKYITQTKDALYKRVVGKAFIKHCPKIIESVLLNNRVDALDEFFKQSIDEIAENISTETITSEFGEFETFWLSSRNISDLIYLPKYYDPSIKEKLNKLDSFCHLRTMGEMYEEGMIEYHTGDEIGKMAYGTGEIPFIRTSDFSNWEIKHNPKQGISEEVYLQYKDKEDVAENDILLVKDGTYLVGSSCLITKYDVKSLYCGGLYKIRVRNESLLDPYLFLGLLNSYIVKRQIRTKQFTRDVIDTIGNRINEVIIPIPKSAEIRKSISNAIKDVIDSRIKARESISELSIKIATNDFA